MTPLLNSHTLVSTYLPMIVQSNVGKSGVRWKLIKPWDVVQGQSIHILSSFGPQEPCAKGGGGQKTVKLSSFLQFFFSNVFPLCPTAKAFLYLLVCFVERKILQFCFTNNIYMYVCYNNMALQKR